MVGPARTDVAIIGAGPVGLFAVFECGMLNMRAQVIDALDVVGGQCVALYPEKPIYDIPGYPRIGAAELIERLAEQAAPFAPAYHMGQRVDALAREGEDWRLTTSAGAELRARAIIIAAGVGAFGPNRPPLARLAEFEGKSVFYVVTKREDFRGRRVVIAGGGDSAIDWTLSLVDVAARVMVVHRRDKFRAAPENVRKVHELAAAGKLDLVIPYQLEGLEGASGKLDGVIVKDLDFGDEEQFTLVGAGEEDYDNGKIQVTSPLAQGLMGAKVGQTVEVDVPAGKMRFEILEIRQSG